MYFAARSCLRTRDTHALLRSTCVRTCSDRDNNIIDLYPPLASVFFTFPTRHVTLTHTAYYTPVRFWKRARHRRLHGTRVHAAYDTRIGTRWWSRCWRQPLQCSDTSPRARTRTAAVELPTVFRTLLLSPSFTTRIAPSSSQRFEPFRTQSSRRVMQYGRTADLLFLLLFRRFR